MNSPIKKLPKRIGALDIFAVRLLVVLRRYIKNAIDRDFNHTFYFTTEEYNKIRPFINTGLMLSLDYAHMYYPGLWKVVVHSAYQYPSDSFEEIYRLKNWDFKFKSIGLMPLPKSAFGMQHFPADKS